MIKTENIERASEETIQALIAAGILYIGADDQLHCVGVINGN